MAAIYWIARVYRYYLLVWVLLSWIPGLGGTDIYGILGFPLYPVLAPFSFLHAGPISFEAIIPFILLGMLERWAGRNARILGGNGQRVSTQLPRQPGTYNSRDFNPMDAADGSYPPPPGNNTGI